MFHSCLFVFKNTLFQITGNRQQNFWLILYRRVPDSNATISAFNAKGWLMTFRSETVNSAPTVSDGLCDALFVVSMESWCIANAIPWKLVWTLMTENCEFLKNSMLFDKRVNDTGSTTHPSAILDQSIWYYHLTPFILLEIILSIRSFMESSGRTISTLVHGSSIFVRIGDIKRKILEIFEFDWKRNKVHRSARTIILPTNPSASKSSDDTINNWWKENGLKLTRSHGVIRTLNGPAWTSTWHCPTEIISSDLDWTRLTLYNDPQIHTWNKSRIILLGRYSKIWIEGAGCHDYVIFESELQFEDSRGPYP